MSKREMPFASFTNAYKPWGQMRRKNLMARVLSTMLMTVAGLAVLAGVVLLFVFAASVVAVGAVIVGMMGLMALVKRKPARVHVSGSKKANGVYEARKEGSTWIVY